MTPSRFPDVNVWLALTHNGHVHHATAIRWLESLGDSRLVFCRFTQLGLLRLLTNETLMGSEVLSQDHAWRAFERWLDDERVDFAAEPSFVDLGRVFKSLSKGPRPSTKLWTDAYLGAFAKVSGLWMVTFDKGMRRIADQGVRVIWLDE